MKVTKLQVVNSQYALSTLSDMVLPYQLAWRVARAVKKVDPIMKDFFKDKDDLVEKLQVSEDHVKEEKYPARKAEFDKAVTSILDEEVEIPIPVISSGLITMDIKPVILFQLNWLIEEPSEEQVPAK